MFIATFLRKSLLITAETHLSFQKSCIRCLSTRLAEVGVLEAPKEHGKSYDTGQLFLHKIFGYRGIVLFPWLAHVYDRDSSAHSKTDERSFDDHTSSVGKEVKGRNHMYYQVLIDARDCPHIRAQTEAVTFLGNQDNSRALYAIPGLDYVAHEDVLPYHSPESGPIQHELFDKFLANDPENSPPFVARDTLKAWQEKNHPWLQLSDVHRETTEGIRVTVIPFYMGCREPTGGTNKNTQTTQQKYQQRMHEAQQTHVYWWRYCVRLENKGEETVRLRERHWRIFSLSGTLETVRGRGVVGQEPLLSPDQPAFQYSSHVSLQAPSGHMWGTYKMERRDGSSFDCKIPPFSLESKSDETPHDFEGN